MATTAQSVADVCRAAKRASRVLASLDTVTKNRALDAIADAIDAHVPEILEANARDMEEAAGETDALRDRMRLDEARVAAIAEGVREIVALRDPVGEVIEGFRLPNGLDVRQVRVPLGVVAVVYEARPNVTIDCTALALKSGNAIVLRGSSQAAHSNSVLAAIAVEAVAGAGCPTAPSALVAGGGREELASWPPRRTRRPHHPPRGRGPEAGAQGRGHRPVSTPRPATATSTSTPAPTSTRPSDHRQRQDAAPRRVQRRRDPARPPRDCARVPAARPAPAARGGVELRADGRARGGGRPGRVADRRHRRGLGHRVPRPDPRRAASSTPSTRRSSTSTRTAPATPRRSSPLDRLGPAVPRGVDAACVYVNASTRFTDGGEFGMGAEIGNSTQKLHARGPIGMRELCTYKYVVEGDGHVRA